MAVLITRDRLLEFFAAVAEAHPRPARLYLVGETSQLYEGWRDWIEYVEVAAASAGRQEDRGGGAATEELSRTLAAVAEELGVQVVDESPGDVIPLPAGYEDRARPIDAQYGVLQLVHFDPYSVAYRFIARGDEPDYHLVLVYLEHGWLNMSEMDERLAELLPRFTNETIQQDPAEFRRRYKGLTQMALAVAPRAIHRHTPA